MVSLRAVSRGYAAVELAGLVLAVFVAPPAVSEKATHFTWWGIASLAAFDLTAALDPPRWRERTFAFFAGTAFTILVGVLGLSVARCTLLSDALDELGFGGYVAGNLAIHYWPAVRVMMHAPSRLEKEANQSLAAASYLVMYLSVNRASRVYGCKLQEWMVVLFGAIGIVAAQLLRRLSNELEVLANQLESGEDLAETSSVSVPRDASLALSAGARIRHVASATSLWLATPALLLIFPGAFGFRPYRWSSAAWFGLFAAMLTQFRWGSSSAVLLTLERWWYRVFSGVLGVEVIIKVALGQLHPVWPAAMVTPAAVLLLSRLEWLPTVRGIVATAATILASGRAASSRYDGELWGWTAVLVAYGLHALVEYELPGIPDEPDAWLATRIRAAGFVGVGLVFSTLAWSS